MDDIINYRSDTPDYYAILGCSESSTPEQINVEYKTRAVNCHPDKNTDDATAVPFAYVPAARFQELQKAKETLTDPEKRKLYDAWRNSGLTIPFEQWLAKKDSFQMTMHWASRKSDGLMLLEKDKDVDSEKNEPDFGSLTWSSERADGIISDFRNYRI